MINLMVKSLRVCLQQMKVGTETKAEDQQKQMSEVSTSAIEQLKAESEALLEEFQDKLKKTLSDFDQKAANKVADQLHKVAEALLDRSATQLQKQAEDAVEKLTGELRAVATGNIQETQKQLAGMTQASRNIWAKSLRHCSTAMEGVERRSDALLESLQGELRNTLQELQQNGAKQAGDQLRKIAEDLQENSAQQLQRQADDIAGQLGEQLKALGTGLLQEGQKQLASMTQESVEFLAKEAKATAEQCRTQLAQTLQGRVQGAYQSPDALQVAAEDAVVKLQAAEQKLQTSFEAQADEGRKRLTEFSTSVLEGLQRQSDALLEGHRDRLLNFVRDLEQEQANRLADQLQKIAEDSLGRSAMELQKRADESVEKLSDGLRAARTTLIQEAQKQLAGVTQESVKSLATRTQAAAVAAAEDAVSKLQAVEHKMEVSLQTLAEDHQERLTERSASAMEGLQGKSGALLEGFQSQLQNCLHDFERTGAKNVADRLQKVTAALLDRSAKELQDRADHTVARLGEDLSVASQRVFQEAQKQFASLTQASIESLTQETTATAEKCQILEKQGDAIRKQIDDLCEASLEKLRLEFIRLRNSLPRAPGLKPGLQVALWLVAMAASPLFIYLSTRSVMRLRSDPPLEFFDERNLDASQRATEDVLAQAYWESAVRYVQWKYAFGKNLPDQPPPEFKADETGLPAEALKSDPAARARYWQKLRQVWTLPQAWEASYTWDPGWVRGLRSSQKPKEK